MKCKYCENKATKKDYREWDGVTGSEPVCDDCFNINNEGLLNRRHEVDKALKTIFRIDEDLAEEFLEAGWGEMWDTISAEMDLHKERMSNEFKSECGHEPHRDTVEEWDEEIIDIIDKLLKKSI